MSAAIKATDQTIPNMLPPTAHQTYGDAAAAGGTQPSAQWTLWQQEQLDTLRAALLILIQGGVGVGMTLVPMGAAPLVLNQASNVFVRCTAVNGQTAFLPPPAYVGQLVRFKITDASLTAGNLTVDASQGGNFIQYGAGAPATQYTVTKLTWGDGAVIDFQWDGTNWDVV